VPREPASLLCAAMHLRGVYRVNRIDARFTIAIRAKRVIREISVSIRVIIALRAIKVMYVTLVTMRVIRVLLHCAAMQCRIISRVILVKN
jgi:hypothetical protein